MTFLHRTLQFIAARTANSGRRDRPEPLPPEPLNTEPSSHETLLLCLLAAVVIVIYAGSLTTPFVFDDIPNIRENSNIRLTALRWDDLLQAAFQSPESARPVANLSFAINYYLHGLNLVGFHLVNILVHLLCGIFLYFFVRETLKTPMLRDRYRRSGSVWIAFFTGFIWLVHPLQTQSVAYLVQRMNSLAAMFYILSMLFYVKFRMTNSGGRKWLLLVGCALAGLLALGSKQNAATLPVFIILYEWYFFQQLSFQWVRRRLPALIGLGLLVILLALMYLGTDPSARILSAYNYREFTLSERLLTQLRVVAFYLSLLMWPHPSRLNLDHDFTLSRSLLDPVTTAMALAAIMVLLALAILTAKKEPLLSFGILWFFGNLVIESSFLGLELVFEHRTYLPSMMAVAGLIALIWRHVRRVRPAALILCLVAAVFSVWTYDRNQVWSDELLLYRDCAQKSPEKARAHNNLGAALLRRGRLAPAAAELQTALNIDPDDADARYNLGSTLVRQGNLAGGIDHFKAALRLQPNDVKTLNNLGAALVLQDRLPEAIESFEKALRINPTDGDLRKNLGIALRRQAEQKTAGAH